LIGRRILIPGLIVGTVIRLISLPLPGTRDLQVWKVWAFAAKHDPTGVYGVGGTPPERRLLHWQGYDSTVDYPPVAIIELAVAGAIYERLRPLFEESSLLNAVVKLPGLMAEIGFVVATLTWGRRRFGAEAAATTALVFWLNPAVLLNGSVLGYLDAQMAVPAAAALAAAVVGSAWAAGALLGIALLTKAQAVFVAPAIVAALVFAPGGRAWRRVQAAAIAGGITSAVVVGPYIVRGAWTNLVQALGRLATHDMLSAQSANIWWLVTWWLRVTDVWSEWGARRALSQEIRILAITRAEALGWPNPRVVGITMVGIACAWAVWRMRHVHTLAPAAALTAWCAYAYAFLAAQVHENHLALAIPFVCIAAGLERRFSTMLVWTSAIVTLNLLLFYGFGRTMWMPSRSWTWIDATVLLAAVNAGVFVWTTRTVYVATRPMSASSSGLAALQG
jgi:hypothetical protein